MAIAYYPPGLFPHGYFPDGYWAVAPAAPIPDFLHVPQVLFDVTNTAGAIYLLRVTSAANTFYAAPDGADGKADFRAISVQGDLLGGTPPIADGTLTLLGKTYLVVKNGLIVGAG